MGQLAEWRKQNWVRIGTDGSIKGPCGTSKDKKNPDRCLPKAKAQSLSKAERAKTARKKKAAGRKGKTVVANTKKARVSLKGGNKVTKKLKPIPPSNKGLPKLPKEVRNKMGYFVDGGRAQKKNGGKIARGCGKVMSNRRKFTTISQEINMPKSKVDPKMQARLDAKVRPDEPVKEDRIYINMKPKKKAPAKKTTKKKTSKK